MVSVRVLCPSGPIFPLAVLRDLPSSVTEISEIEQPDEVYYRTLLLEASDTLAQHNIGFV
jgi:hypothetical protein